MDATAGDGATGVADSSGVEAATDAQLPDTGAEAAADGAGGADAQDGSVSPVDAADAASEASTVPCGDVNTCAGALAITPPQYWVWGDSYSTTGPAEGVGSEWVGITIYSKNSCSFMNLALQLQSLTATHFVFDAYSAGVNVCSGAPVASAYQPQMTENANFYWTSGCEVHMAVHIYPGAPRVGSDAEAGEDASTDASTGAGPICLAQTNWSLEIIGDD
jgi:hypothetical protein